MRMFVFHILEYLIEFEMVIDAWLSHVLYNGVSTAAVREFWRDDPTLRPTFETLHWRLEDIRHAWTLSM